MSTVACLATGPTLTLAQIESARRWPLFGCNLVYQIVPDLTLLYCCNEAFYDYYWHRGLREHGSEKWTTNETAAKRYNLNWIAECAGAGLCTDPNVIHHGHGSGQSLVSMAHKKGFLRIILLGYSLRFAKDYSGQERQVGSTPRHFFGEYPSALQHWPSVSVRDGDHFELVEWYRSIHEQGLVELVNSTPDSALESFLPYTPIEGVC